MDSRAEFEAWAVSTMKHFAGGLDLSLAMPTGHGGWTYATKAAESSWRAWQASRQGVEGEAAFVIDRLGFAERCEPYTNLPEGTKLYTHPASTDVPDGYALVPKMMTLDFPAMEMIRCMTGESETEDEFAECVLWVGETLDDDGKVDAYGLNIACSECMEEGSVSVIEFAKPAVTGTGEQTSVPNEHGKNRYGLDMAYFRNLFNRELNRPLTDYRPDELARVLARAARTADPEVLGEAEFRTDKRPTLGQRKAAQIGPVIGVLVQNQEGGVCAVTDMGRCTWLSEDVTGAGDGASVPDAEYISVLQDACDIIQADANTEENYASLCRIGAVLVKLRATPTKADDPAHDCRFSRAMDGTCMSCGSRQEKGE